MYQLFPPLMFSQRRTKYITDDIVAPSRPNDCIHTYLNNPVVPTAFITGQGGLMKYWYHLEGPSPGLSRMASDFLSAPCKSCFPPLTSAY